MRRLRRIQEKHAKKHKKFKQGAVAAGTAAVITFGVGTSLTKVIAADKPNKHQFPVSQDADADLLSNVEEIAIGYSSFISDQNRNQIPDGVELAQYCAIAINKLPSYFPDTMMPIPNSTHKVVHNLFGIELCDICGQEVNMGGIAIINPQLGLQYPDPNDPSAEAFLPDLALHYMEHGSFDYFGDVHSGRVDIPRLLRTLQIRYPYEPNDHQLTLTKDDLDGDFLTDIEELATNLNLHDADQDDDLNPDGIELARQCAEIVDSLPVFDPNGPEIYALYKVNFLQRGLEYCDICGETVNMGYWQVTNLKLALSIDVPVIVLHYMNHGSFNYAGDVHGKGRIKVPFLVKILEMPNRCGDLGTIYSPIDLNKDCKVNSADFVEFMEQWLKHTDSNEGQNDEP